MRARRPSDAVDHLERLVGDDPEVALLLAQERLRVWALERRLAAVAAEVGLAAEQEG